MVSTAIRRLTSYHSVLVPCSVEVPTREIFFAAISVLNTTAALPEEYGKHLLCDSLPTQKSYLADVLVKESTKSHVRIEPLSSRKTLVYTSFPEHFAYVLFLGYLYSIARKAVQEMVLEDFRDISFFSGTYPIQIVNWAGNADAYGRTANDAVESVQVYGYAGAYGDIRNSILTHTEKFGIGNVPIPKTMLDAFGFPYISSATHFVPANYARTAKDDALTGLMVDLDAPLHLNYTEACSLNLQVSLTLGGNSSAELGTTLSADGSWYITQHAPFSHHWGFPRIGVDAQLSSVNMVGKPTPPSFASGNTLLLSFFNEADSWHADSIKLFDIRTNNDSSEFKLSPTIIGLADPSSIL